MPTLLEAVARCVAQPAPVVLLDTCALLDLIREAGRADPNSPQPRTGIARAARALLALASQPVPRLHFVCYELVPIEWNDHEQETNKGAMVPIRKAEDLVSRLNSAADSLALPAYTPSRLETHNARLVIDGLADLGRRILASSTIIELDEQCEKLAGRRTINNVAPADKGKPELKDCMITEHYLALSKLLPAGTTRVFVSSNFNDYGKNYILRSPLNEEFAQAGIQWAGDFIWAQGLVEGKGRR